jgi:hypothetical protein
MTRRFVGLVMVAAWGLGAFGCASDPAPDPEPEPQPAAAYLFDASNYAQVFQAAKDVLREYQFELDRVDARSGIITTQPKPSAGLATPWIPHSGDFKGSVRGLIEHEQRRARVEFVPAGLAEPQAPGTPDLREATGAMVARIEVEIDRVHRPHRRASPTSIKLSSFARDTGPTSDSRSAQRGYQLQTLDDESLGQRMIRALERASAVSEPS